MREKWCRRGLIAIACTTLSIPTSRGLAWDGSYAADGHCYCSGTLDPALARKIVPTPLGGQSIAAVCERIGTGPGLPLSDGHPDRMTFADPQCGNGPFSTGPPTPVCAGDGPTPGCWLPGPRWNLEAVYSRRVRESVAEAVRQLGRPGTLGAVAAPPVLAGAVPEPRATIVLEGSHWHLAPPGTPERGAPGSRVVFDGHVYLSGEGASGMSGAGASVAPIGTMSGTDLARPTAERMERPVEASVGALRTRRQALMTGARPLVRARHGQRAGSESEAH